MYVCEPPKFLSETLAAHGRTFPYHVCKRSICAELQEDLHHVCTPYCNCPMQRCSPLGIMTQIGLEACK